MRTFIRTGAALGMALAAVGIAASQDAAPKRLPYAAVHDPEFVRAADAAYVHEDDRIIGLTAGETAKAYPASILSQHGLVEDETPKGPIAITW